VKPEVMAKREGPTNPVPELKVGLSNLTGPVMMMVWERPFLKETVGSTQGETVEEKLRGPVRVSKLRVEFWRVLI
jgi:hypothetical protein